MAEKSYHGYFCKKRITIFYTRDKRIYGVSFLEGEIKSVPNCVQKGILALLSTYPTMRYQESHLINI